MMSIYTGKITRVDNNEVWAEIPELAIDQSFPCRWVHTDLMVGDFVLVVNIDGAQENLVVVGRLNGVIE